MESISSSNGIRGSVESLIGGRQENQDSYGMSETRLGLLVVVCDGMGGGPAGKTASSLATQAIIDYVSGAPADANPGSVLEDAVVAANEAIMAAVNANPSFKGMGTTCVCLLLQPGKAFVVHVGDSRLYQVRGNKAIFRTADHSYVGELVRRGTMSEEDARNSKYSNVITRAIGASEEVVPELDVVATQAGDRFGLMSDGIWGAMPEPQLVGFLAYNADASSLVPEIAARVDAIGKNEGGGHDNLTLAIVQLPGSGQSLNDKFAAMREPPQSPMPRPVNAPVSKKDDSYELSEDSPKAYGNKGRGKNILLLFLGGGLLVAVTVIVCLLVFFNKEEKDTRADNVQSDAIVDGRGIDRDDPDDEDDNNWINEVSEDYLGHGKDNESGKQNAGHGARKPDSGKSAKDAKSKNTPEAGANAILAGKQQGEGFVEDNNAPQPVVQNKEALQYISNAITKLQEIQTYNPGSLSPKDKDARQKKRQDMLQGVLKQLTLSKSASAPDKAKDFDACISGINKKGKKIIQVDKTNGVSTADANKAIQESVEDIRRLKNKL